MMLTRSTLWSSVALAFAIGCGGGGDAPPADAPKDIGFTRPTAALKANQEGSGGFTEIGPADLSCLNTPSDDQATTVAVDLTTTIRDFQKDPPNNLVPGATVTIFKEQNIDMVEAMGTSDAETAMVTLTVPVGTKRFGFKVSHASSLDTLLLNQTVDPATMAQTIEEVRTVSKQTAQTLPALIGVSRTAGTGVLAGAMRDCAGNEISNFVATVSTTQGQVNHLDGADAYYFANTSNPLPQRHSQVPAAAPNGLFMIIEMQPTTDAYVQIWGYPTEDDLANDRFTLVSELKTSVIAETVITGSYEPLRQ